MRVDYRMRDIKPDTLQLKNGKSIVIHYEPFYSGEATAFRVSGDIEAVVVMGRIQENNSFKLDISVRLKNDIAYSAVFEINEKQYKRPHKQFVYSRLLRILEQI